jgi:hypothetical protein
MPSSTACSANHFLVPESALDLFGIKLNSFTKR